MKLQVVKRRRQTAMATIVMIFILAMVLFYVWLNAQILYDLRQEIHGVDSRQQSFWEQPLEEPSHESD